MAHYNSDDGLTVEIFEQNRRRLTGIAYGMLGSLMDALERLKPTQRAVLLLRDVLDMEYAEIADIVGKTPANCRQIASRARDDVARQADARYPVAGSRHRSFPPTWTRSPTMMSTLSPGPSPRM